MPSSLGKIGIYIAALVGVYSVILGTLLIPSVQRFSLYAHKFNTLFYKDIDNGEDYGFAKNQVTPFTISTPDGETLYIWHILPVDAYTRNEKTLLEEKRPQGPISNFEQTTAYRLLTSNAPSPARVVVNFHGNAGHVAQGWRTDTYRTLTAQANTHVLSIDYRGFGKSTGTPTERGLIIDGVALVNWIMHTANIPPANIVLLGQSLGTAVASAVALHFADSENALLAPSARQVQEGAAALPLQDRALITQDATAFAGIILVAPFASLPSLMLTYRIGGFIPILLPLRPFPSLADYFLSRIVDQWPTADRLAAYYDVLSRNPGLQRAPNGGAAGEYVEGKRMGLLQVLHARNDFDISHRQSEMICQRVLRKDGDCIGGWETEGPAVVDARGEGRPRVRFEILEFGGHNRIVTYSPVAAAVVRAFEDIGG